MLRALALSVILASTAACGSRDPAPPSQAPPIDAGVDDLPPLFGDDRVAQVLGRDPTRAPRSLAEHEALFGVGRACPREGSREVYVIEEAATRVDGRTIPTSGPVPRVVVTGCSPDASLAGAAVAYGLFTVVSTDPARDPKDPLSRAVVEAMALDRTTGAYQFYVFDPDGMERIVRGLDGRVRTVRATRDGAVSVREDGPSCFGCHVHGEPIMATLADPWTSWVSTRARTPIGSYVGETASIVAEASAPEAKRASFANALEPVVRNAIRELVFGRTGAPGTGIAATTDVRTLLRSVFCETQLQWASANETIPLQLFVDPGAAVGAELARPSAVDAWPALFPVRSEIDLRIEEGLVARSVLSSETVRVVRLLDDARDVLSPARCALLPRVLEGLPEDRAAIDAHVREVLRDAITTLPPPTSAYARALLDRAPIDAPRAAYFADLRARLDAEIATLSKGARAAIEARVRERRLAARAMFPGDVHPLPIAAVP